MKHLSQDQFYETMNALDTGTAAEHLAGCAQCRAEVETVRCSLQNLRGAATGLARSEFRPLLAVTPAKGLNVPRFVWPLALAAAGVACAASVTLVHRPVPNDTVRVQAVRETLPAEADDALLDGINQDLSTSVPPSLAPLDVSSGESTVGAVKQD